MEETIQSLQSLINQVESHLSSCLNGVGDALEAQANNAVATGQRAIQLFQEGGVLNDAEAAETAAEATGELLAVLGEFGVAAAA